MYDDFDNDIDDLSTISARDCTGLMPALPQSEYEWESYQALYSTELNSAVVTPNVDDDIYIDNPKDKNP
ncbi:MAG: hypothetical protein J6J86_09580 [Lachnospiraceae bacterium]|nr:hypothetical protein [Lachnospiraceae bacterium]